MDLKQRIQAVNRRIAAIKQQTQQIPVESKSFSCQPLGFNSLKGKSIRLERSSTEHVDFIYKCYQNDSFMDLYRLAQNRRLSKSDLEQRLLQEQAELPQNVKRIEWVILKEQNGNYVPVGLASLADYQVNHSRAELLLGIEDSTNRKAGISLEASLLVMDFAFNQASLNKICSFVYGYNDYAQKNTLHLGFSQEGILIEHINSSKGFINLYQNGLIKSDFRNNKTLAKLSLRLLGRDITQHQQTIKVAKLPDNLLNQLKSKLGIY